MQPLAHWTLQRDADGTAWAILDCQQASANVLTAKVMAELALLLDECERQAPRALIFKSGKAAGFIAGADIDELARLDSGAAARELIRRGWDLYNRLAAVSYPTLALIRGHCLGGGTELALACRYRIAVDEAATRIALPEVMLGIVPGWGGMLRLPQTVGAAAALDMMLAGKSMDARRAKKIGLVDACVSPRVMDNAARMLANSGQAAHKLSFFQRLMNGPLKGIVAAQARKKLARRASPQHYPAPYAILDTWAHYGGNALAVPKEKPASLEALITSPTTKNLLRVFSLQDRLKGFGKAAANWMPRRVHVVGAGVMGGDIAAWCALSGLTVTLQDQGIERIAPAIGRAAQLFEKKLRDKTAVRAALDRLIPDPEGTGVRQADVIIEAIFENLAAKQALFARLEQHAKPQALLASNTSSLRLAEIAQALVQPERLVGMHFFNPVAQMPLVEVVASEATSRLAAQQAAACVRQIDKLPLPVKDAPGFLVNAVLAPYLNEAMRCVDEGLQPETIDAAALAFGMPMGPIELADTVGLDIALAVGRQLVAAEMRPKRLEALVAAGCLGKKSGRGFYVWAAGKAKKAPAGVVPAGLMQRLLAPLFAATAERVAAGVVGDADLADAGVILGAGFAPYTGGPMNYRAQHPDQT
jgi:3-hydroxyacyl-CoA dehydrogenase/enoyl-CoA hydratase/3-hydroxybutyryl-CoA epimerase